MNLIFNTLVREEGVRLDPYRDHLGFWTIGIGHLIDRRKGGSLPSWVRPSFPITREEADEMCRADIAAFQTGLAAGIPWWSRTTDTVRAVLTLMAFQMGVEGVLKFRVTLAAIERGDWDTAADQMLRSLWADQTPDRARRMVDLLRSGVPSGEGA